MEKRWFIFGSTLSILPRGKIGLELLVCRLRGESQEPIDKHTYSTFIPLIQMLSRVISIRLIKNRIEIGSRRQGQTHRKMGTQSHGSKTPTKGMIARLPKATISIVPAFINLGEAGLFLAALGNRARPSASGEMSCRQVCFGVLGP